MKKMFPALVLAVLAALPVAAEELNVDKILAAQSFGVGADAMLAKVNDPANTVAPMTAADVDRLRAAGIPEAVVSALQAKASMSAPVAQPAPPTAPTGTQPDNPRAITIVKAVQAGTSEALIVNQIMQAGVNQRPTLNDLIYMKENKVPEGIIRALMEAPLVAAGTTAAGGKAGVPTEVTVDGLVRTTGLFSKNRTGKLTLTKDKIDWMDGTNQADSFEMFPAGLKAVEAKCLARAEGKFCHEVTFEMSKGDDFTFVDAKKDVGGNESIQKLLDTVKTFYPKVPIVEKVN